MVSETTHNTLDLSCAYPRIPCCLSIGNNTNFPHNRLPSTKQFGNLFETNPTIKKIWRGGQYITLSIFYHHTQSQSIYSFKHSYMTIVQNNHLHNPTEISKPTSLSNVFPLTTIPPNPPIVSNLHPLQSSVKKFASNFSLTRSDDTRNGASVVDHSTTTLSHITDRTFWFDTTYEERYPRGDSFLRRYPEGFYIYTHEGHLATACTHCKVSPEQKQQATSSSEGQGFDFTGTGYFSRVVVCDSLGLPLG